MGDMIGEFELDNLSGLIFEPVFQNRARKARLHAVAWDKGAPAGDRRADWQFLVFESNLAERIPRSERTLFEPRQALVASLAMPLPLQTEVIDLLDRHRPLDQSGYGPVAPNV